MHRLLAPALACASFAMATAGMAADEKEGPWSGSLALGYLAITGNTESNSLNADAELKYDLERWHHTLSGRAVGKSEDKVATAEAYKASYDLKYDISERTYAFGLLDWNKDRFSAYEQQTFEVAGLGRRFIMTERHQLNGEIGFGAAQNDLADGTSQDEFTTRISGDYTWKISENAEFVQKLAVNISSSNTFTESVTELRAAVVGNLGLAVSYTIKNNSDVVPGTEKTDTWTAVNLDYKF